MTTSINTELNKVIFKNTEYHGTKWNFYTINVKCKGNIYRITFMTWNSKEKVEVTKITNNPFGGRVGKDFVSFDSAADSYKMPELKIAILLAGDTITAFMVNAELEKLAKCN